jgi:hypothetical protein
VARAALQVIAALAVIGIAFLTLYGATTPIRYGSTSFANLVQNTFHTLVQIWAVEKRDEYLNPNNGWTITNDPRVSPIVNRVAQVWIFQAVNERSPDPVPY